MTEKTRVCRFGIEVVCSRPAREKKKKQSKATVIPETFHTPGTCNMTESSSYMHSIKGCTMCPCLWDRDHGAKRQMGSKDLIQSPHSQ